MEFTFEIAKAYRVSPFDILKEDMDSVIMAVNYFIEKSDIEPQKVKSETDETTKSADGVIRKRVTNKTATGGWY